MSNNSNTTSKTNSTTCSLQACNGFGTCDVLHPGTSIESFECLCDLWHTGQRCELDVPHPIAVAITTTLLTSIVLFFCWYSSHRFSNKKIHTPAKRYRFADYLHEHQKKEKSWLKSVLDADEMNFAIARTVPNDEKYEAESHKSAKSIKKPKEKQIEKPIVKPKENSKMQAVKEDEKLKKLLDNVTSQKDISEKRHQEEQEELSNLSISGPLPLKSCSSSNVNVCPDDAPPDYRKMKQKEREMEEQLQKDAEKKAKEMKKRK